MHCVALCGLPGFVGMLPSTSSQEQWSMDTRQTVRLPARLSNRILMESPTPVNTAEGNQPCLSHAGNRATISKKLPVTALYNSLSASIFHSPSRRTRGMSHVPQAVANLASPARSQFQVKAFLELFFRYRGAFTRDAAYCADSSSMV